MRTRNIKANTEYQIQRHIVRMASPRHVLTLEADLSEDEKRYVYKEADKLRRFGNALTSVMMKCYEQLVRTKKYRATMKTYGKAGESGDAVLKKELIAKLKAMQEQYNVTWCFCCHKAEKLERIYGIGSSFAITRAKEIWSAVEKLLYCGGEHLHLKERGDLPALKAQNIRGGIAIHAGEEGKLRFKFGKLYFNNIYKPKDKFINDELAAIRNYFQNPEGNDRQAVEDYLKDGTLTDTYRPCYAALKCITIRGKLRVFIYITLEGKPMRKYRKVYNPDGSFTYVPKHKYGTGNVGVDIGTQTIAYTSKTEVGIKNLAERGDSIQRREAKERRLRRAMDHSLRAMNQDNFNPDGTCKRGKKTWIRSKRYMKLWAKLKELSRISAENRHYAINEDVNHLRELGNVFITEPKNAAKLRKKSRPQSEAELADPHVKNRSRKRCGKSIQNRCPGYLQSKAKEIFESTGGMYVEVSDSYRASQYDHVEGSYTKGKLQQRMRTLCDGTVVQRDMYSSFLLSNPDSSYTTIDRDRCEVTFQAFHQKEQARIEEIQQSGKKVLNSGIRPHRKPCKRKST
ncbi:MAG: hypothetical protein LUD51_04370 [Clostridia bacterium]|nr:hypothetical protein [Clostridia bacterium]